MSGKNQFVSTLNWQATDPRTSFLPLQANTSTSPLSGVTSGAMASTNTIYSNIIDVSRMDNDGLEVAWTGTPTGTVFYWASNSGINWFQPSLVTSQPGGSAGVFGVNLNQWAYKYIMLQYTNISGAGTITVYAQMKDLN